MQKGSLFIYLFSILFTAAFADVGEMDIEKPSFIDPSKAVANEPLLMINNRPLAKINGKVISLYDVVKKMDLFLYDYYPESSLPVIEKYQYYMGRWETTLDEMISDELVLLDAEQKEIKISDGEVREDLEERFGPNIMSNLDKVNLQYEEAREMIRNDLTVQQLIGMKVHAKAFQIITPEVIKKAYTTYLAENPPEDEWKYQVLSIRGKDKDACAALAKEAFTLLQEKKESLDQVAQEIVGENINVSLSDDYSGPTQKISNEHFEAIETLKADTYSAPISQVSRFDNSTVYRIFHLKDRNEKLPEAFNQMHDKLKNELLFETSDIEKKAYINTLKKRFGYDKYDPKFEIPEDYRPFLVM